MSRVAAFHFLGSGTARMPRAARDAAGALDVPEVDPTTQSQRQGEDAAGRDVGQQF